MPAPCYRALVVDDEPAIRHATARALLDEGFTCDHAADGKIALGRLESSTYDVIVTDMKMPEMNGHALAVHLLNRARNRPLIIVQTGIIEPRLARDLFARGVDDIVYKPCDQRLLAMKIKRMIDSARGPDPGGGPADTGPSGPAATRPEITMQDIDRKLAHVSRVLPVSQAAIDVFCMVSTDEFNACQIASAIQRDAALAVEVLRIANTAHYNPAGKKIASLEEAVTRIGQRRIAELAVATNALAAVTAATLPWLDVGLTWRRSLSAGVAAEILLEHGEHDSIGHGLILCAIAHHVGRVVVGTLYPSLYPALIESCQQHGTALVAEEAEVLPTNHARIMSKLLKLWNIPLDVYLPMAFLLDDAAAIARLGEPMRTRIELIRCALAIGNIAVGRWEPWDLVEVPSGGMLRRLNIRSVGSIIQETCSRAEHLLRFRSGPEEEAAHASPPPAPPAPPADPRASLTYVSFTDEPVDLVQHALLSMGVHLERIAESANCRADVVNGLDLPSDGAAALLAALGPCQAVIVDKHQAIAAPGASTRVVQLPASHAAFVKSVRGEGSEWGTAQT